MKQTLFYLATNAEGDVCGDEDRNTAVKRLQDQYGGETITVSTLKVMVPRPAGYVASIIVRDEIDDDYIHRV